MGFPALKTALSVPGALHPVAALFLARLLLFLRADNMRRRSIVSYRIEDLDVYRRCTAAAVKICRLADEAAARGAPALGNELRRRGVGMAVNLADGLGFWDREEKERHFTAAKKAVLEALSLLEITAALGLADTGVQGDMAVDLRDLAKMTAGLLRGARRREQQPGGEHEKARAVQERPRTYH